MWAFYQALEITGSYAMCNAMRNHHIRERNKTISHRKSFIFFYTLA